MAYVSPSFSRITGYTPEEYYSDPALPRKCIHPDDQKLLNDFLNPDATQGLEPFVFRWIHKDGRIIWIEPTKTVIHDECGEVTDVYYIARDITKRKMTEEKQQAITKTTLDGFWICDLEGRFLDVNDSYCKMTGYNREELLGMSIRDIEAVENPGQTAQRIKKIVEQGTDRFETQHKRKDGKIIDIEISVNYLNIGEGQMCVFVRDITERKQAEIKTRQSEKRYRLLAENVTDVIWTVDINNPSQLTYISPSVARLLGYSVEEAMATKMAEIFTPASFDTCMKVLAEEMSIERREQNDLFRSRTLDLEFYRKDGKIVPVEIKCSLIREADSRPVEILVVGRDITERKRAKEALANEAIRRRILVEQSRDGIVILDENGKVYETNRRFAEMLGYSVEEVLHLNVWDWEYQYPPEQVLEMIRTVDENGDHFETRHRRKDGSVYDVEISTNGARFADQKLIFCVCRDITQRKQAQEALRESEEKFSKAFHASPTSVSISRLGDGKFIEVNESFLRDKGYTREEIIGRSSKEFEIWANQNEGKRIMKILKEGGHVHNEQMQFRTKEGYVRTGLISAEIISIGNEPCMLVMNNDITQQKLAEERLRLLSSVTQQVSDSTIITDPHFNITYMNQAAQDLLGYSAEEVLGKGLDIFNAEPIPREVIQNIFQTVASGKVWSATVPKRRKDGNIIFCESRVSPLYDEKGQVSSFIDVQRDVTEQKEMEVKLQEHKQLIESILAAMPEGVLVIDGNDRIILANKAFYKIFHRSKRATVSKLLGETIHIDQLVNLYEAVKRGEDNDNTLEFRYRVRNLEKIISCAVVKMDGECTLLTFIDISRDREEEEKLYLTDRLASIGEMAAGLAHELNNPLTGILALSQLLVESDISGEYKEDLQSIYGEAKRAASIVKNVLVFARNNTYENGQASVNEVVRDVLRLREHEEKVSNIQVVTNLEDKLPDITIDRYQLQQVFLNIILNAEAAIKDTNRPGILTVTTERANDHVNIMFKDNGCGIKKHIMPRIFDPFFTTKEIGKGTGLGLSICYSIVVKHGGKISVRSQVNKGSTFTIKVPVVT
jgi:nitrogen fixation negative regulator NifL